MEEASYRNELRAAVEGMMDELNTLETYSWQLLCRSVCGAGLGPAQTAWCVQYIEFCAQAQHARQIADEAFHDDELMADFNAGERNAFHHAYWMALMTGMFDIPVDLALQFGAAHEMDTTYSGQTWDSNSSIIDLHNNAIGAAVGGAMFNVEWTSPIDLASGVLSNVVGDTRQFIIGVVKMGSSSPLNLNGQW